MAATAIALASCSNDDLIATADSNNAIYFRATVNHSNTSRGTETDAASMDEFIVTAIAQDQNKVLFPNLSFKRVGSTNEFLPDDKNQEYVWSQELNLDFYAIGYTYPKGVTSMPLPGETGSLLGNIEGDLYVTEDQQTLNNFQPQPNIKDQIDLVYAFAHEKGSNVPMNGAVSLVFNHILSELEVRATCSSKLHQVEVKGLKYGNIDCKGQFDMAKYNGGRENPWTLDKDASNNTLKTSYEIKYTESLTLSSTEKDLSKTAANGWAIIMPQTLTTWNANTEAWDSGSNGQVPDGKILAKAQYVALLIRVTALDETGQTTAVKFPLADQNVDEDGDGIGDGFGWAYIPLHSGKDSDTAAERVKYSTWQPGNRYIYHLDFTDGAGYNENGDPILKSPIKFTISVNPWHTIDINRPRN